MSRGGLSKYFTLFRQEDRSKYTTLQIMVVNWSARSYVERKVYFSWQTDTCRDCWYAYHARVESTNPSDYEFTARLMKKIASFPDMCFDPQDIVHALKNMGYAEANYHSGLHQHISYDNWPAGATYGLYLSDGTYLISDIADSEDEARLKLTEKVFNHSYDTHSRYKYLVQEWLESGKPVKVVESHQPFNEVLIEPHPPGFVLQV